MLLECRRERRADTESRERKTLEHNAKGPKDAIARTEGVEGTEWKLSLNPIHLRV